ncbi:hypothetical protein [Chryseobacterium culicis]|jgi:hypothetical protein|uniref:hypothetical protein n=1 Tax=Chryseobacterium culicis TaxID=680127 RepID=UPI00289ACB21|nr:hypothetical protein [Chryseobacterium culicis]
MDDFEKIKDIWSSEKSIHLPDSEEIKSNIQQYKSSKRRNMYLLAVAAFLCLATIIVVIISCKADHYTKVVGEVLIFLGILIVLFIKVRSLKKSNISELTSNKVFLDNLKNSTLRKSKTSALHMVAFVLIGAGYAFYMYMYVLDNKLLMIFSYSALVIFLLFMYFIFRPFTERISRRKVKRLIDTIEGIKAQIKK